MIERVAGALRVTVPMRVVNATALLEAGCAALGESVDAVESFDFGAVTEADSSALAVMLGWQRAALALGRPLKFINLPASVLALADLYGVDEFLALA